MKKMIKCIVCENELNHSSKHNRFKKSRRITCSPDCSKMYQRIASYIYHKKSRKLKEKELK